MNADQVKAVVTGGASGLGFAVAERLVADGGEVALFDINDDTGARAADDLGTAASYYPVDVRSEDAMASALAEAARHMGGLNVAVSCAGVIGPGRALGREGSMPLDHFANVIAINLVGTFNLCKAAAAIMAQAEPGPDGERGVLINTASIAAWEGQVGQSAYAASKGGVVGLTLPLAREFTRFGIRVMAIAPGVFRTPMMYGIPEEARDALASGVPFPSRLGDPAEFADTVAFIIGNRYMNGSTIRVDGAIRLQPR